MEGPALTPGYPDSRPHRGSIAQSAAPGLQPSFWLPSLTSRWFPAFFLAMTLTPISRPKTEGHPAPTAPQPCSRHCGCPGPSVCILTLPQASNPCQHPRKESSLVLPLSPPTVPTGPHKTRVEGLLSPGEEPAHTALSRGPGDSTSTPPSLTAVRPARPGTERKASRGMARQRHHNLEPVSTLDGARHTWARAQPSGAPSEQVPGIKAGAGHGSFEAGAFGEAGPGSHSGFVPKEERGWQEERPHPAPGCFLRSCFSKGHPLWPAFMGTSASMSFPHSPPCHPAGPGTLIVPVDTGVGF